MAESVRDRRRSEIISAARRLVVEGGVEGLTIGRLEGSVDFTRGVITYHFRDKNEIVTAVLNSAVAEIDAATAADFAASATLQERVHAVLHSKVFGFLGHPEAARIVMAFWARASHDPHARQVSEQLFRNYRKQARSLAEVGGDAVDTDAMAALLVGTVIGVVTQVHIDPQRVDPEDVVREAARALSAWLSRGSTSG